MKIQHLAVIFVIIILPISILLSEFIQVQINTLNLQTSYDSKLLGATYDAVVAFQKNTINSTTSDIITSKIRDVEASANTFMNSISSNFSLSGNTKEAIQTYIPAVVYTLYDGYYIYSKFNNYWGNTADDEYWAFKKPIDTGTPSKYEENISTVGLKPYVYYSREYTVPSKGAVTITYSLDNYITIQGKWNNNIINDGGFLVDNIVKQGADYYYRGQKIDEEELREYVDNTGVANEYNNKVSTTGEYEYVKVNGTKYYANQAARDAGEENYIFYFGDDRVRKMGGDDFYNTYFKKGAIEYYKRAYEFTNFVRDNFGNLKSENATFWNKLPTESTVDGTTGIKSTQTNYEIFKGNNIEEPNSDFNQERRAVIKYAIEKNLSTAIANYNNISGISANFQMPKLQENEWDKILSSPSVISFLQGMNLGTKTYNGYAIVTNTKNLEVVSEDSIYITTGGNTENGQYHRVTENDLKDKITNDSKGYFNISFERRALNYDESGTRYYYPQKNTASYDSIVSQTNVAKISEQDSIYTYLSDKDKLAKIYYTALGRERYGMYRYMKLD